MVTEGLEIENSNYVDRLSARIDSEQSAEFLKAIILTFCKGYFQWEESSENARLKLTSTLNNSDLINKKNELKMLVQILFIVAQLGYTTLDAFDMIARSNYEILNETTLTATLIYLSKVDFQAKQYKKGIISIFQEVISTEVIDWECIAYWVDEYNLEEYYPGISIMLIELDTVEDRFTFLKEIFGIQASNNDLDAVQWFLQNATIFTSKGKIVPQSISSGHRIEFGLPLFEKDFTIQSAYIEYSKSIPNLSKYISLLDVIATYTSYINSN